jgi:hypothetical protein
MAIPFALVTKAVLRGGEGRDIEGAPEAEYIEAMRAQVDLSETQLDALAKLGQQRGVSRDEVIRTAVDCYLAAEGKDPVDAAFGLWGDRGEDGVAYQRRLREEW